MTQLAQAEEACHCTKVVTDAKGKAQCVQAKGTCQEGYHCDVFEGEESQNFAQCIETNKLVKPQ